MSYRIEYKTRPNRILNIGSTRPKYNVIMPMYDKYHTELNIRLALIEYLILDQLDPIAQFTRA